MTNKADYKSIEKCMCASITQLFSHDPSRFYSLVIVTRVRMRLGSLCAPGKDYCGPPGVDSKMEDSSDIPILEDTSSSHTDCPQLCWLVATDIENIEK